MTAMIASAIPRVRSRIHHIFWKIHIAGIMCVYPLLVIHGTNLGSPYSWMYLIGPLILYALELLYCRFAAKNFRGHSVEACISAHPGGITKVSFPKVFKHKEGQYLDICIPLLSHSQYHPFTIASSTLEEEIAIFVKDAGDWTHKLHELSKRKDLPVENGDSKSNNINSLDSENPERDETSLVCIKAYVQGAFGSSCPYYSRFKSCLCIGIGIGATPFRALLRRMTLSSHSQDHFSSFTGTDDIGGNGFQTTLIQQSADLLGYVDPLMDLYPQVEDQGEDNGEKLPSSRYKRMYIPRILRSVFYSLLLNMMILWLIILVSLLRVSYHTCAESWEQWSLSATFQHVIFFILMGTLLVVNSSEALLTLSVCCRQRSRKFPLDLFLLDMSIVIASSVSIATYTCHIDQEFVSKSGIQLFEIVSCCIGLAISLFLMLSKILMIIIVTEAGEESSESSSLRKYFKTSIHGRSKLQQAHLIWTIRDVESFQWMKETLHESLELISLSRIRVDIFITSKGNDIRDHEIDELSREFADLIIFHKAKRPSWGQIINTKLKNSYTMCEEISQTGKQDQIDACDSTNGTSGLMNSDSNIIASKNLPHTNSGSSKVGYPLGVFYCGPKTIGREIRGTIRSMVLEANSRERRMVDSEDDVEKRGIISSRKIVFVNC